MTQNKVNKLLLRLYPLAKRRRSLRKILINVIHKFEGGEYQSCTLREIFRVHHGIEIGLYTHGGCFVPGNYDRFTVIGRYCSIAMTSSAMNRNHPMEYKSMHGYFFNPMLGMCSEDKVEYVPLNIGNDVWIGHNAIIMPNVKSIGEGAVVGAGAVVNKDVPPYGVVVGNPGRVVRYRFSEERIQELLAEKWWEKDIDELKESIEDFQTYANPTQNESE
jgi:acetyltransferase-like isoleucine patch superfamily enzyme